MEIVINSYGVSLNRDNEGFVISTSEGRQRIPAEGVTSIQVSRGAQITSDAVLLAIEREIEILFLDKSGNPIGRVWSPKYGSISTIRKGQLNFTFSRNAVEWIKGIVRDKIKNQQALILTMNADGIINPHIVDRAINRLEDYRTKIRSVHGEVVNDIASAVRGWEGISSKIYFEVMNNFIPEQLRFEQRSQHPAMDPVNALLNYGYGLLYGKVEGSLIKAGIDPYIGVLHRDNYNRPVLVYDVIEIYRVWVDYVIYSLAKQDVICPEYFSIKDDGSYWLEALGKRVLIQSLNDYMEEVVDVKGLRRSRMTQIQLFSQNLAKLFKNHEQ